MEMRPSRSRRDRPGGRMARSVPGIALRDRTGAGSPSEPGFCRDEPSGRRRILATENAERCSAVGDPSFASTAGRLQTVSVARFCGPGGCPPILSSAPGNARLHTRCRLAPGFPGAGIHGATHRRRISAVEEQIGALKTRTCLLHIRAGRRTAGASSATGTLLSPRAILPAAREGSSSPISSTRRRAYPFEDTHRPTSGATEFRSASATACHDG
jgi:hypothetical protein